MEVQKWKVKITSYSHNTDHFGKQVVSSKVKITSNKEQYRSDSNRNWNF